MILFFWKDCINRVGRGKALEDLSFFTDAIRRGDGAAAAGYLRDGIEAYKKATE
ncbi:MAG: hypothetical protein PUC99_07280 [Eubacteriales bacterium]|nr:hypothetical protein [Lachnospiraceae bacterium]MCH4063639.1 hypothetical protein [Lachnospiraceae bacterium]MCH4103638.1 hypothetical protein [Lachnospiraceae bacterium]MDD5860121.1 hypothetical protein [Eubacteriales bacterium]